MTDPLQGEIWWVDLEPTLGSEANKTRPCVVVGSEAFAGVPLRVVVPRTTWKPYFFAHPNKTRIAATAQNGLDLESAADALQIRAVATERFEHRAGTLTLEDFTEVRRLLAVVLDFQIPADDPLTRQPVKPPEP